MITGREMEEAGCSEPSTSAFEVLIKRVDLQRTMLLVPEEIVFEYFQASSLRVLIPWKDRSEVAVLDASDVTCIVGPVLERDFEHPVKVDGADFGASEKVDLLAFGLSVKLMASTSAPVWS